MSASGFRLFIPVLFITGYGATAVAADSSPSFNYAAVNYQEFTSDLERDFDGVSLEVSGQLGPRWFISGSYAQLSTTSDPFDADRDVTWGRLGYLAHHRGALALYGGPQVMYVSYDVPVTSNTDADSDTSAGAFIGMRFLATPSIEFIGEVNYASFSHGNSSNFLQYTVGVRTFLTYRFALEARAQFGDWDGFMLGGSMHF